MIKIKNDDDFVPTPSLIDIDSPVTKYVNKPINKNSEISKKLAGSYVMAIVLSFLPKRNLV